MKPGNNHRPDVEQAESACPDQHRVFPVIAGQGLGEAKDNGHPNQEGFDCVCKRCHSFSCAHCDYANQEKASILSAITGQMPGFFVGVLIACFGIVQWLPGAWDSVWDCTGSTDTALTCTKRVGGAE